MRYRRIKVSSEVLTVMFMKGQLTRVVCIEGLPSNAQFVYSYPAMTIVGLDMVFYSQEWDELDDGAEIPFIDIKFEKVIDG
jgi:hypothetical protein